MVPFVFIYIFNWVVFLIIFTSLLRKKNISDQPAGEKSFATKLKQKFVTAVILSLLFGLGWGVGMIATTSIPTVALSYTLQTLFILLTAFQGLLLFIMNCVRSTDVLSEWKEWVNVLLCHKKSLAIHNMRPSGLTASTLNSATIASTMKGDNSLTRGYVAGNGRKGDSSLKNEKPKSKTQSNNAFSNPIVTKGSGKIDTSMNVYIDVSLS